MIGNYVTSFFPDVLQALDLLDVIPASAVAALSPLAGVFCFNINLGTLLPLGTGRKVVDESLSLS